MKRDPLRQMSAEAILSHARLTCRGRADMLDKEATAGGGYKNLSMTWFRAAKDTCSVRSLSRVD